MRQRLTMPSAAAVFLTSAVALTSLVTARPSPGSVVTATPLANQRSASAASTRTVQRGWLDTVNRYRAAAKVPPIREDPELSRRARLHSRYVVLTNQLVHAEDPSNAAYTREGDEAGRRGAVQAGPDDVTGAHDIDEWMRAPFHALGLIDPTLQAVGFGAYNDPKAAGFRHAATLYLRRPPHRNSGAAPVLWPGDGTTVTLQTLGEKETPSPYSACPGYEAPTGLPIVANLGDDMSVLNASVVVDGIPVEACIIDADRYVSADAAEQADGRAALGRHQAMIVPRKPLVVAKTYTVTIEATTRTVTSTFRVAARPPTRLKAYNWTITNDHLILLWVPPDDGGLPVSRYYVAIEPGGLRFELPGTASGAKFDYRLRAGPTRATVWAENPAGTGDAIAFGFTVPESVALGAPTTLAPPQPTTTHFLYGAADPSETTTTVDSTPVPSLVSSAPTSTAPTRRTAVNTPVKTTVKSTVKTTVKSPAH